MSRKPLVIRPLKPKEQQTINRERLMAKEDFERGIAANLGAVQKAHWENQAEKAFAKRLTREGMEAAAKAHEEEVLSRRRRLADLFNDEMESWHHEILSRVETTEDRKNKIRERAYALKARNEAARQAFVKECYDRRWRDACDDARLLDGKALLRFVADSRLSQIEEKKDRKEFMKKDEEQFFEAIKKHVQRLEAIEKEKEDRKERLKHETIATLEQQIKWSEERRKMHKERTAEEDEAEIEFIRQEIQKEQEKLEAKRRHAYEAGKQVRVFNEKRLGMRAAVKAEEKSQDQQLLDHALLKEQAEIAAEEAKKEKAKQESIAYQNYLKDLMIREKLDESATEDIRKKQENEVWEKRDEVQRKQKHARDYLMKQVMEGRQMQMALKKLANQEEAVLEDAQVSKWRGDIEQGLREDRAKVEARKKADQDNNAILLRQMEERRKRAQFEKQQEYLLYKHMRKEEEEHVRRQQEQAGRVRLHYPLVSSKWMS